MNEGWLDTYLAEVGREIDLGSTQLHETTNWAIGVVIAVVTGIAVAPTVFPTPTTFAVVVVGMILLTRFFVRSCLAYVNLNKWSKIQTLIVQYRLNGEEDVALMSRLRRSIEAYHIQWESAEPIRKILWSNLKLGYLQLFSILIGILSYGLITVSWDWKIGLLCVLLVLDLMYEVKVFPNETYFRCSYKPDQQSLEQPDDLPAGNTVEKSDEPSRSN